MRIKNDQISHLEQKLSEAEVQNSDKEQTILSLKEESQKLDQKIKELQSESSTEFEANKTQIEILQERVACLEAKVA